MARSGFYSSNGSGDFFIAFSTAYRVPHSGAPIATYPTVSNDAMSAIFAAIVEATEEAVINSLTTAETMVGRDGNTRLGIDIDDLIHILKKHDSLGWAQKLPPFGGLS
jgi:D-aminopeptidase